jgi:hypothetical protein
MILENWKNSMTPTLNGRILRLMPYEVSRCVALAPDDQTVLVGTVWHLRLFDRRGRELWRIAVSAGAWAVNIAANGAVAAVALADGTIRWYRMADGQELLALFPHPDSRRWVAWTPSGYYDAGPGAESLLGWHKNYGGGTAADFFPAAQFRGISYRPAVVRTTLETLDEQQAVVRTSASAAQHPSLGPELQTLAPETNQAPLGSVIIISPPDGSAISTTSVKLRYRFPNDPSGASDVIAMVDGRIVPASRGVAVVDASQMTTGVRELDIAIPERDCEVSLAVTSRGSGMGKPDTIRLKWQPPFAVKPKLYAIAIETGDPQEDTREEGLTGNDAKDFGAVVQLQAGGVYRDVSVKTLVGGQATKDAILDGLDWLDREVTGKDIAMIFMKGEVVSDRNGIPYLLSVGAKTDRLRPTAFPLSDLKNVVGSLAGHSAIFLDTCHGSDPRHSEACTTAGRSLLNDLSNPEQGGVVFLASSVTHQVQERTASRRNGAFATAVIEGLKGKAAYGGGKRITVNMLDLYISERMKT